MILDTNALSALLYNDQALIALLTKSSKHHIPSIVLGEYRFGLLSSTIKRKFEENLNKLEAESYILDVDASTARYYAEIRNQLKSIGRPIPGNDLWIASLARQHNLEILSRDRHFDAVPGIRRIGW